MVQYKPSPKIEFVWYVTLMWQTATGMATTNTVSGTTTATTADTMDDVYKDVIRAAREKLDAPSGPIMFMSVVPNKVQV